MALLDYSSVHRQLMQARKTDKFPFMRQWLTFQWIAIHWINMIQRLKDIALHIEPLDTMQMQT